jgi:hypothetical protein
MVPLAQLRELFSEELCKRKKNSSHEDALFVWLISHQPALLFSQNKPATSKQPAVFSSQNKSAPAINHRRTNSLRITHDLRSLEPKP